MISDLTLELLEMDMHEQRDILNWQFRITRVVWGWIYDRQEQTVGISNPVFIPNNLTNQ